MAPQGMCVQFILLCNAHSNWELDSLLFGANLQEHRDLKAAASTN